MTVDRPPVVSRFIPESQALDAFVGDTLRFQIFAIDPDETSLKQRFSLDDSVVANGPRWNYVVHDTGMVSVKCVVTDGVYHSRIQWEVSRHMPVNYPPVITRFQPIEAKPVMIVDNEMKFAVEATDPDGDILKYRYTLDDSLVTTNREFLFHAGAVGEFDVKVVVNDGEHFVSRLWELTVTPEPDTIPPSQVQVLALDTGVDPGEVYLEWIAVGADQMDGIASNYLVRTSPSPIIDEISWSRGSERPGVPLPANPGETMSMVLDGLLPARFTHVAVRAVDDFGNLSPLGPPIGQYTRGMRISGKVMDSVTGLPLSNVSVELAHFRTTTDIDGEFEFIELPLLDELLIVSDDGQSGEIGAYFDFRRQYKVEHLDYHPIYLLPNFDPASPMYDNFLTFFIGMTEKQGTPFPRHQHWWEAPIEVHALPFENGGLDYRATVHQTALDLNPYIGMDVLNVVDEIPAVGVLVSYDDNVMYDNFGVDEWTDDWYPVTGSIELRKVYTLAHKRVFERVVRHELGHALGLNHLEDDRYMMVGGVSPQVDNFHPDEIAVIRSRFRIPLGTYIGWYVQD